MKLKVLIIICLAIATEVAFAQDSLWTRTYQFGLYNQYDLRNSSTNMTSVHRLLLDGFRKGIKPKMNAPLGNVAYGVVSFATTYMSMLWSHEFGHSLRAEQVGGHFNIHDAGLPIPYTTMDLPSSIGLVDEALSVTAGFEVNSLNTRAVQTDFVNQNGIYNEDLAFAFANRLMYPLYTSVIVPRDPEKRDTWINTAGDPVHVILPVFRNYSNNKVFNSDSIVNPDLVRYYNQSAIFGILFNMVDPQVYREIGGSFGKNKTRRPIFILGEHGNGWTYGTLFNVSPLGYELYFNNYIHVNNQKFSVYFKYGNPFKNNGFGFTWTDIIKRDHFSLSGKIDLWDQDLFRKGIASELYAEMKVANHIGLFTTAGYKTKGYVLGKQINEGFNGGMGLIIYSTY
ncbi:MAG: hypothetical protein ACFHWX_14230 [Bacteroidota bacterium]